jgi:hypothetical protein
MVPKALKDGLHESSGIGGEGQAQVEAAGSGPGKFIRRNTDISEGYGRFIK